MRNRMEVFLIGCVGLLLVVAFMACGSSATHRTGRVTMSANAESMMGLAPQPVRQPDEMLSVGQIAPAFSATDQAGNPVSLSQFRGKKNVVLVFYPGDDTPGCTKQLCAVRDDFIQFQQKDVAVFGVNPQNAESHERFVQKYDFPFPLLVDQDKDMIMKYGAKGKAWTQRTVYGIDKQGVIVFAERGMPSTETILAVF